MRTAFRICVILPLLCAATHAGPPPAIEIPPSPNSLWSRRSDNAFLFYDTQARRIGDVLLVLVNENTDVQNREQRRLEKETEIGTNFDFDSATSGDLGISGAAASVTVDQESERSFDGESAFTANRGFTDRVAVTVLDVHPNGNLVIGGERRVMVAGDERRLIISGIVRPIDIGSDNSVPSRRIAEFRMTYDGAGAEQAFTNQGWLGRITNRLWPF